MWVTFADESRQIFHKVSIPEEFKCSMHTLNKKLDRILAMQEVQDVIAGILGYQDACDMVERARVSGSDEFSAET